MVISYVSHPMKSTGQRCSGSTGQLEPGLLPSPASVFSRVQSSCITLPHPLWKGPSPVVTAQAEMISVVADGTGWCLNTLEPWFLLFTSDDSPAPELSVRHPPENFAYLFFFFFLNFTTKNCK